MVMAVMVATELGIGTKLEPTKWLIDLITQHFAPLCCGGLSMAEGAIRGGEKSGRKWVDLALALL